MAATRQNPRQIGLVYTSGGAVAQLGERLVRNEEVRGSTPLGSTITGLRHPSLSFAASHKIPSATETTEHFFFLYTFAALRHNPALNCGQIRRSNGYN
jgi:hypothetical protein